MKLRKFMKKFIEAKPEVFLLLSILYILIGVLAINDPYLKAIDPNLSVRLLTVFVWFFGLVWFWLGIKYSKILFKFRIVPIILVFIGLVISFYYYLNIGLLLVVGGNISIIWACSTFIRLKKNYVYFFHSRNYFFDPKFNRCRHSIVKYKPSLRNDLIL